MRALIVLVAVFLAGCSGIQLGEGRPTQNPAFGVGGFGDLQVPEPRLYRENKAEVPYVVQVEYAPGKYHDVRVYEQKCIASMEPFADRVNLAVYLCGEKTSLRHELAHLAGPAGEGMDHNGWQRGGGAACTTITRAGNTRYVVGSRICTANGYEWVEKK